MLPKNIAQIHHAHLMQLQISWCRTGELLLEGGYGGKGNNVLNVFIDIQTSKGLIQMDTDKMMTYGTFTMDDEKLTQS